MTVIFQSGVSCFIKKSNLHFFYIEDIKIYLAQINQTQACIHINSWKAVHSAFLIDCSQTEKNFLMNNKGKKFEVVQLIAYPQENAE